MSFVVRGRGSLLVPVELQSASPGGRCSSNPPPPTQIAQSQVETTSPLAEGRWDDWSDLDACVKNERTPCSTKKDKAKCVPALNHDLV